MSIVQVALPIPTRRSYDYLNQGEPLTAGLRVRVPFGNRSMIGVVLANVAQSDMEQSKLKPITDVLDTHPVVDPIMLKLGIWLGNYYHHPVGEVMHTLLPTALRKGKSNEPKAIAFLRKANVTAEEMIEKLGRAKKQKELIVFVSDKEIERSQLNQHFSANIINALIKKGLLEEIEKVPVSLDNWQNAMSIADKPRPNTEQSLAITAISHKLHEYNTFLLEGVTGSGKTEVYLQSIESVLAKGKQVLILVPEIGLTPQTVGRFRQRFGIEVGVLHSNLTDNERLTVWQQSRAGEVGIIIGTRSAIFTPMKSPGMLIVDEEHDGSYKQQDGLRYNARDLAVLVAKEHKIPLVLGSATPSLESLNNALQGRYHHLVLSDRAGAATHARQHILDIKNQPLQFGLAQGMVSRIRQHLEQGNQVMLFINRRGYAPALLCHQCGYVEECARCNVPFTLHKQLNKIQCHHCGAARAIPKNCQNCGSQDVIPYGLGTEQLELGLSTLFTDYDSVRIDSDSARGKTKLSELLDKVNRNQHQILIGTQILSKGHHFPNVTLVVILDADGALFSADFRAAEHLAQLITQLSGRAGRAEKPGEMWLQTHNPGHPLLQDLVNNGYGHFARYALLERKQAALPPFIFFALFRAEATDARLPHEFLAEVSHTFGDAQHCAVVGPIPALMEKRQGRYRMQLLVQSSNRAALQHALSARINDIEQLPMARKVRWSIDVDPQDFM